MILTLIGLGIIIVGIILLIIYKIRDYFLSSLDTIGEFIIVIGVLYLGVCIGIILLKGVGEDHRIKENKMEYEALQKRIEVVNSEYEDVSKSELIEDIKEWNIMVYKNKYWSTNKWTNWFYNKKVIDELKYIDFEEVK